MTALDEKALEAAWDAADGPLAPGEDPVEKAITAYLTALSQSPVGEELRELRYLALSAADEPNKCQPADVILRGIHAIVALQAENERLRQIAAAPSDKVVKVESMGKAK